MAAAVTVADPHPAPLAIGVTGHRPDRLAEYDVRELSATVATLLDAIARAAPRETFRLVSSLAEGADSLVAQSAIERGWPIDVVLPFPRQEYAIDFDHPRASGELDDLITSARSLFELPGLRDEPGGSAAAYERAGRVLLAQSDLLLAIWDGGPSRGRGGSAQLVAEAVGLGVPVLFVHPHQGCTPVLLWSGLDAHEFGPESVDTVARGTVDDLPRLFARLDARALHGERRRKPRRAVRPLFAAAYPLLLASVGVRGLRASDFLGPRLPPPTDCGAPGAADLPDDSFAARINGLLVPPFAQADRNAALAAQMFRSAYVSNFALAALAVLLSLLGLLAPPSLKPVLVIGEFLAIASILAITRAGSRAGWHGRWLHARQIAERLRCLALSARLGDLMLRGSDNGLQGASRDALHVARGLGLPSAQVDRDYLVAVHDSLLKLIDEQTDYLGVEARRMHRLEHRLHRLGGLLFATTALLCAGVLITEGVTTFLPQLGWHPHLPVGLTVISASLPAIGAAIYGIRMQGDFAGVAQRNAQLADQLGHLRRVAADEVPDFDGLRRIVRRVTELLTQDVSQWFRSSLARPLSLPG